MPCTPGLRSCAMSNTGCEHLRAVCTYRDQRLTWELAREQANPGMFPTELRDWELANPAPTFKQFLLTHLRRCA